MSGMKTHERSGCVLLANPRYNEQERVKSILDMESDMWEGFLADKVYGCASYDVNAVADPVPAGHKPCGDIRGQAAIIAYVDQDELKAFMFTRLPELDKSKYKRKFYRCACKELYKALFLHILGNKRIKALTITEELQVSIYWPERDREILEQAGFPKMSRGVGQFAEDRRQLQEHRRMAQGMRNRSLPTKYIKLIQDCRSRHCRGLS